MPIVIYTQDEPRTRIAELCDESWHLPDQAEALEAWLRNNQDKMNPGQYIADIGFCHREDALGGGAALSPETLRRMADLGMWLFLSEYPGS